MIDPRLAVIDKRLAAAGRILVFASGKGGVGKSLCSAVTAVALARTGYHVGLLDLDFQGASAHIILGVRLRFPEEHHGLVPLPLEERLSFMIIAAFTGEKAVPLRGRDVSNAIIELLTVTVWPTLDYLVVDMPPGIGDEVLDLFRFMRRSEIVVVSVPSVIAARVAERLLRICLDLGKTVIGTIENMTARSGDSPGGGPTETPSLSKNSGVPLLGTLPYDPSLESCIGSPGALLESDFGRALARTVSVLSGSRRSGGR